MLMFWLETSCYKQTLENTEWAIKNGQSRETGNIGHTRHRKETNKAQSRKQKKFIGRCYNNWFLAKTLTCCVCYKNENKKKCPTTGPVLKFNRKIVERGKIYPPITHMHDRTLPWLGTCIRLLDSPVVINRR
jgi:hypothetical protein